jgi:hypothetical protein
MTVTIRSVEITGREGLQNKSSPSHFAHTGFFVVFAAPADSFAGGQVEVPEVLLDSHTSHPETLTDIFRKMEREATK